MFGNGLPANGVLVSMRGGRLCWPVNKCLLERPWPGKRLLHLWRLVNRLREFWVWVPKGSKKLRLPGGVAIEISHFSHILSF
jgi:hypothetical protein